MTSSCPMILSFGSSKSANSATSVIGVQNVSAFSRHRELWTGSTCHADIPILHEAMKTWFIRVIEITLWISSSNMTSQGSLIIIHILSSGCEMQSPIPSAIRRVVLVPRASSKDLRQHYFLQIVKWKLVLRLWISGR